ncbi:MAG: tetratricopeptide repeat protein [Gemmatimonadaceae bacterium]|nr:tetratricopeptide repeat protein [Gemmatimonadaceae bacterium]
MPMRTWSRPSATLAVLALGTSVLGAQAPKCDIPTQNEPGLITANIAFGGAFRKDVTPEAKAKALAATVKALTENPTAFKNQAGRNFVLAQALITWLEVPGTGVVESRGKIGYTADPTGRVDLHLAIDSAVAAARTEKPECGDSLKLYTNGIWGSNINKSVDFLNRNELDSASAYARRAILFDPRSYYAYNVLANVAQTKEDTTGMIEWFTKAADVTAGSKDTTARKVHESMLQNLGAVYQNAAVDQQDAAKKKELQGKAVAAYRRYLESNPSDFSTRLRIMRLESGGAKLDSAAAAKLVAEVTQAGTSVTDAQLVDVGSELSKSEQYGPAMQVYGMALKRNPASRDALYNTAVALNNTGRFEEIAPYFAKLRTLDPNNRDLYELGQNVIRGRRRAIQTAANKGKEPRPGQTVTLTPAQNAQMKVLQDSLLAYGKARDAITPIVQVTQFSPLADGARFGAYVQVPPTKPAGQFTITVEFLNAQEQVVTTGTATTKAAVQPGSGESLAVDAKGAGIVAFRYRVR